MSSLNENRILIILPSLSGGGAEKVGVNIAKGLSDRGWDVTLLIISGKNRDYEYLLDDKTKYIFLNTYLLFSFVKIYKFIKMYKFTKIISFSLEISGYINIYRKILCLNCFLVSRCITILSKYNQDIKFYWRIINKIFLKKYFLQSDIIVAQSKLMKEDLIKNYKHMLKGKVVIINNPIFTKDKIRNSDTTQKKVSNYILYVGRFSKQKNLLFLLESYKELISEKKINCYLYLVGKGDELGNILSYIRKYSLDNYVKIFDFTTNVYDYYSNAKVTVLTSFYEGFNNVLLESIAIGTPVVAFEKLGGIDELIVDGLNGFKVKYLDKNDFKEKLLNALNYQWDINEIKLSAKKFSFDKILKEYEDILKC